MFQFEEVHSWVCHVICLYDNQERSFAYMFCTAFSDPESILGRVGILARPVGNLAWVK